MELTREYALGTPQQRHQLRGSEIHSIATKHIGQANTQIDKQTPNVYPTQKPTFRSSWSNEIRSDDEKGLPAQFVDV